MEKEYKFEFEATIRGFGIVYAESEDEATDKIMGDDYDDIIDTYDMEIKKITEIQEEEA